MHISAYVEIITNSGFCFQKLHKSCITGVFKVASERYTISEGTKYLKGDFCMLRKHVFVLCCLVLSVGCARKAIIKPAALEPAVIKSDVKDGSEPSVRSAEWAAVPELKTIYFDYDKALLKPAARDRLVENSGYLKAHPELVVIIEGHCDERGTNEYNMGLGQQRAALVREYYGLLG